MQLFFFITTVNFNLFSLQFQVLFIVTSALSCKFHYYASFVKVTT